MKFLALVFLALFIGCATTEAYTGPIGSKAIVALDQKRHIIQEDPRWVPEMRTISTLKVTNPSMDLIVVTVECDSAKPLAVTGTVATLDIPARTTQNLLLLPEDQSCLVKQWE